MSKNETTASIVEAASPVETIGLDEFCSRLSETVKSVELIGGFHFTERAASVSLDTFDAFKARFDAFVTKPVQ